jgi:hypothetical protein
MTRPQRAPRASAGPPSAALARRLRELRETSWPDRAPITQKTLSEAFGLALSSISSYETEGSLPDRRLRDYATFFSTERSIDGDTVRVLPDHELTTDEIAARDRLLDELQGLRSLEAEIDAEEPPGLAQPRPSMWSFPDGGPVRIICGELEEMTHPYSDPKSPNYTKLLKYADADALIELFGHVRMRNPDSDVRFMQQLSRPDDLSCHLVMLGGTGLNLRLQELLDRTDLPIEQREHDEKDEKKKVEDGEVFYIQGDDKEPYLPEMSRRQNVGLIGDVGLFARLRNPYNTTRTLTWCSGIHSRGVYGAVRTLTDAEMRDQNEAYLGTRFGNPAQFAILMRVPVLFGDALTPDLTNESTRLYEWSDVSAAAGPGHGGARQTGHADEAGAW